MKALVLSLCLMGISFMFHGYCLVGPYMVQRLLLHQVLMPTAAAFTAIVFIDSEIGSSHSRSIDYIERNKKQRLTQ